MITEIQVVLELFVISLIVVELVTLLRHVKRIERYEERVDEHILKMDEHIKRMEETLTVGHIKSKMLLAFVLIDTDMGFEGEVLGVLKGMEAAEAYVTHGPYKVIAKIEAETMDEIEEMVRHVRKLDKVRDIMALIVIKGE